MKFIFSKNTFYDQFFDQRSMIITKNTCIKKVSCIRVEQKEISHFKMVKKRMNLEKHLTPKWETF